MSLDERHDISTNNPDLAESTENQSSLVGCGPPLRVGWSVEMTMDDFNGHLAWERLWNLNHMIRSGNT